jgi:DNA-binding XRE family transcriptional regulator
MFQAHCLLRSHRKEWCLTQEELARLLLLESATEVSRIEAAKRNPGVEVALASEVLFGAPARNIYPQLYKTVEEEVMREACGLRDDLALDASLKGVRKRALLSLALKRAVISAHLHET